MHSFANWIEYLSDDEIEKFSARYLTQKYKNKGYTNEDYVEIKRKLTSFKEHYIKDVK